MTDVKSILIVGVGGQGTLLASKILGTAAFSAGLDVKVSEVHGMSQRGGSVVTYVRYGGKVYSPLIEKGQADIVMSFEQLEALRWIEYLKTDGAVITNTQKIMPMPVIMGVQQYPDNIFDIIKKTKVKLFSVDALDIAKKLGNTKVVNTVLIGVLASKTDINKDLWIKTIKQCVPEKYTDVNLKAFEKGYSI